MMRVADVIGNLSLGTAKQVVEGTVESPLHTLLIGLHQEIIDRLTKRIDEYDAKASNRLKQSLITVDESQPGNLSVAVSAEFYWKYVNYGVNGTQLNRGAPTWGAAPAGTPSFKDAILGWIRDKGMMAKPGQTYDQMAFAIMRVIRERGIEARPFFTDVVNQELIEYLTKSISLVYAEALTIKIVEPWQ